MEEVKVKKHFLIIASQIAELYVIFSYLMTFLARKGTDYFEDILLPFILFLIAAVVFFTQIKAIEKFRKLISYISIISIIVLSYLVFIIHNKGYDYFQLNWWNFEFYKYRNLIIFLFLIVGSQVVKLLALNINKLSYQKIVESSRLKKFFVVTAVILVVGIVFVFVMQKLETHKIERTGTEVVKSIEKFRSQYGRLPESRAEMGLPDTESTRPFYTKISNDEYELNYPIGFDGGYVYYSKIGKWQDYPSGDFGCANDDYQLLTSPNGQHTARLFRRDCGATTDYSGHVTLDSEPIFVLNHYYGKTIEVNWINDTHLFIQYAYKESPDDVSIFKTEYKGIKLEYFYWPCIGPVDKHPKGYCLE